MKLLCLFLALALNAHAASIPATTGMALDGRAVNLPRDLSPHVTVLILGFSKNSQHPTTEWEKAIRDQLSGVAYFDIPFLEDAPTFVRPMILRNISKQVPDIVKPRFLPLTSGELAWKQAAQYSPSAPDAAYILLVDGAGTIRWQTHQPLSTALIQQIEGASRSLTTN